MSPIQYPICYYRGDSFRKSFKVKENGVEKPLTGVGIMMQVRTDNDTLMLTFSSSNGKISVPTPSNGEFFILDTPAIMAAVVVGVEYYYDIQFTFPDGSVETYLRGPFTVTPDITHA